MTNRAILALPFLTFVGSAPSFGVGFRLPNQDPVAIARGNAFAATADNPSAMYYNPAGITYQHSFSVGLGRKGERWSWAATYQLLTGEWQTVQGSQSTSRIGESADGQYKFFNHALNVSIGYRF
jgi:hypothetical protein